MKRHNGDRLTQLLDKQDLMELAIRFLRGVDRADEELVLSCYHPDAYDDHGPYKGSPAGFVDHLKKTVWHPTTEPIQHCLLNPLFEVDGETAYGGFYVTAYCNGQLRAMVRYVDRYERRNDEWRVANRRLILESGRPGLDPSMFVEGRRDRTDPSYER